MGNMYNLTKKNFLIFIIAPFDTSGIFFRNSVRIERIYHTPAMRRA